MFNGWKNQLRCVDNSPSLQVFAVVAYRAVTCQVHPYICARTNVCFTRRFVEIFMVNFLISKNYLKSAVSVQKPTIYFAVSDFALLVPAEDSVSGCRTDDATTLYITIFCCCDCVEVFLIVTGLDLSDDFVDRGFCSVEIFLSLLAL